MRFEIAVVVPISGEGTVHHTTALRLAEIYALFQRLNTPVRVYFAKHYAVDISRELGVDVALLNGATHILFIDSDIVPESPQSVLEMLALDLPFVCGVYWEKNLRGLNLHRKRGGYPPYENLTVVNEELKPVDACGLGFALIDAEVFKALEKPWFSLRPYGEDAYFAEKAAEIGVKPVAYAKARAYHSLGYGLYLTPDGRLATL